MKKLNLSKYKTNAAVQKAVEARIAERSFEELLAYVNESFIYQEAATRAIYLGLSSSMNVFLSGESGYGKSELIKCILEFYKIEYNTIVGYKDMPVDALLGIPDMKKLLEDSEYVLKFSKSSFGEAKILIGEEFTDISAACAAALRMCLQNEACEVKALRKSLLCRV